MLAACGGGGGGGSTTTSSPITAGIAASVQRNPANVINIATQSSVEVDVEFGADVKPGETFEVVLTDGVNSVSTTGTATANDTITVGPIDASTLSDGPISLAVNVINGSTTGTTDYGAVLTKDTVAPEAPLSVALPQGTGNPVDTVNLSNQADVAMNVTFSPSASASDLVNLVASDGVSMITSAAQNIAPGGTNSFTGFDLSNLSDGALVVNAVAIDAAENTSMVALAVQKDTVVPTVLVARINAGSQNPANTVNLHTEQAPVVDVVLDTVVERGDTIMLRATDGDGTILDSMPVAVPANGGAAPMSNLDVSSLVDGELTFEVVVQDASGNIVTQGSFATTKDTTIMGLQSAIVSDASGEAVNAIGQSNVSAVYVRIEARPGTNEDMDEEASVTISANGASATSPFRALNMHGDIAVIGPIDCSAISSGTYAVTVNLRDVNGNTVSFAGTSGVIDTGAPAGINSARVQAGGSNPIDTINSLSISNVSVEANFQADPGTRTATVVLSDGVNTATSTSQNVPAGGGNVVFTGMNATGLGDGTITISVVTVDGGGNSITQAGTAAAKDTFLNLPTGVVMEASVGSTNIVNAANASNYTISVQLPFGASGPESYRVQVFDSSTSIISAPQNGVSGALLAFPMNLSSLADGTIGVAVVVDDRSGNTTMFNGPSAIKDVVAPAAPTSANVAAGTDNPANVVTAGTAGSAVVDLTFGSSAQVGDQFTVAITDSSGVRRESAPQPINSVPGGGRAILNLTGLADGQLRVEGQVTDFVGNSVAFTGTPATMDTQSVAATSAKVVATNYNADHVINSLTAPVVTLEATFPASIGPGYTASMMLEADGVTTTTPSLPVPDLGGTMNFYADASMLAEGTITVTVNVVEDATQNVATTIGTPATKDTEAPEPVDSAAIVASMSAPEGFVNNQSQSTLGVVANYGAYYVGSEQISMEFRVGAATLTAPSQTALPVASAQVFPGFDVSSLPDGELSVEVTVTDVSGNTAVSTHVLGTKDTEIEDFTATFGVVETDFIAEDTINITNEGSVSLTGRPTSEAGLGLTVTLTATAGHISVSFPSFTVDSLTAIIRPSDADLSSLRDGQVTLTGVAEDEAGNQSTFAAGTLTKDTSAPSNPTAAKVVATASNPDHFVNTTTQGSVSVELTFPITSETSDNATVTISDGSNSATGTVSAPAGGGTVTATGIDCTGFTEGAITVSVDMEDNAKNTVPGFTGTAATFDVTPPAAPVVDPVTSPWSGATQQMTGVGVANSDVVIDGGAAQAEATADAGGAFAISVSLTASMTNSMSVMTRDAAFNLSTPVTVDFNGAALDIVQNPAAPAVPFSDATVTVGLGDTGTVDGGAFADIDNDGDLDLFIGQGSAGILYEYDAMAGTYTDITAGTGVTFAGDRSAVWGDFDNDGDVDLLTVDSVAGTSLYRNEWVGAGTRTFTDVTVAESATIASINLTQAMWLDHNNDGYLDFIALDATLNNNFLMVNQRGAMVPANSFLQDATTGIDNNVAASAFGAVADFDVDGDIDVIFGDSTPGLFYRNDGATTFTDIAGVTSNVSFDHSGAAAGITFVDYDNDGDLDIFIARGGAASVNQMWRNDGGSSFTEVAALAGIDTDVTADDVCWGDLNNDGILDLFVGSDAANKLYLGLGDTNMDNVFEFTEIASNVGVGVDDAGDADMVQMADIDNDGDLDLFVGNEGAANILYQNDLNNFNFLKVRVTGQGTGAGTSSSDARGAVVTLKDASNNVLATREISGGRGKGSQDCAEVHFGGVIPSVEYTVEVSFPSGTTQTVMVTPRLEANQTTTVNE